MSSGRSLSRTRYRAPWLDYLTSPKPSRASSSVRWLDAASTERTLQSDGRNGHQVSCSAPRGALPESVSGVDGSKDDHLLSRQRVLDPQTGSSGRRTGIEPSLVGLDFTTPPPSPCTTGKHVRGPPSSFANRHQPDASTIGFPAAEIVAPWYFWLFLTTRSPLSRPEAGETGAGGDPLGNRADSQSSLELLGVGAVG
jgi:hypothetical protein